MRPTHLLNVDASFTPCPIHDRDELFPNGIFEFNITRMLEYLENSPNDIDLAEVAASDFHAGFSSIDELHVELVDISRPVVLAEISPEHYNLIDGHHRMEKARRLGTSMMRAYKLTMPLHAPDFTLAVGQQNVGHGNGRFIRLVDHTVIGLHSGPITFGHPAIRPIRNSLLRPSPPTTTRPCRTVRCS